MTKLGHKSPFYCIPCARSYGSLEALMAHKKDSQRHKARGKPAPEVREAFGPRADTDPDWTGSCEVCGQSPVVPATGMCGPCTFGEAETVGGNW